MRGRRGKALNSLSVCRRARAKKCEVFKLEAQAQIGRLGILTICGLLGITVIVARLVMLKSGDGSRWEELALRQHTTSLAIQGARGEVFDAKGRALATSVEAGSIAVRPRLFLNGTGNLARLSEQLELSEYQVKEKISSTNKPFVWVKRFVQRNTSEELLAAKIPGVEVFPEFSRNYPQGELARVILGQVSMDGRGQSGIELQFDKLLAATSSKMALRRDARGGYFQYDADSPESMLPSFMSFSLIGDAHASTASTELRQEGRSIQLTIDSQIQGIVEEELEVALRDAKAKRVIGILMDAESGELLALGQKDQKTLEATTFRSVNALRNSNIQDNFEPGSTLKPLIAAIALDRNKVRTSEIIDCTALQVGRHTIRDAHPVGVVPFPEVLVRSSNIGIAKIGQRLGSVALHKGLQELGFGKRSGIELPGEENGILRTEKAWKEIDVATASFGQGMSVTALQLVRAYAALASGGILPVPTLVKAVNGEKKTEISPQRVFSAETAKKISEIIVGVTESEHGTGRGAQISGLKIAGKTGTAQKPGVRGYDPNRVFASFIGFTDTATIGQKGKMVLFVGVDEPGVFPRWGGVVAAPAFKRIMERVVAYRHSMSES